METETINSLLLRSLGFYIHVVCDIVLVDTYAVASNSRDDCQFAAKNLLSIRANQ